VCTVYHKAQHCESTIPEEPNSISLMRLESDLGTLVLEVRVIVRHFWKQLNYNYFALLYWCAIRPIHAGRIVVCTTSMLLRLLIRFPRIAGLSTALSEDEFGVLLSASANVGSVSRNYICRFCTRNNHLCDPLRACFPGSASVGWRPHQVTSMRLCHHRSQSNSRIIFCCFWQ
jgi:hypothetical protein